MSVRHVDLTVVGAGIVGVQAALLARLRHPGWRVVLIDAAQPGRGASGQSAGVFLPGGANDWQRTLWRLGDEVRPMWESLVGELPQRPLAATLICVEPVRSGLYARFQDTDLSLAPRDRIDLGTEHVYPHGDELTFNLRGGHVADVAALVQILRELFVAVGGELITGVTVEHANFDAGTLFVTGGKSIVPQRLLACPGPWITSGPWARAATAAGVRTKRIVAFELDLSPSPDDSLVYFWDCEAFLLPLHNRGRWLLSIRSPHWDEPPPNGHPRATPEELRIAGAIIKERAPALAQQIVAVRAATDGYSPGGPVLIPLSERRCSWLAAACSGSGYRLGAGLALAAVRRLETS